MPKLCHSCVVIITQPHCVIKFCNICEWCMTHVGLKNEMWQYQVLEPHGHPWRVRFNFANAELLAQFSLTWNSTQ